MQVGIMMASRNLMVSKWIDSVGANKAGGTFLEDVRAEMHYSDWVNTTVCTRPDDYCAEEAPGVCVCDCVSMCPCVSVSVSVCSCVCLCVSVCM